jgi:hypothetical protein
MGKLDFAFFNLINRDKKGLFYQKGFLDRLSPFIFYPRIKNLIQLAPIHCQGCHIVLPLGAGNLQLLEPSKQQIMFQRSCGVARDFNLQAMAVNRSLKDLNLETQGNLPLIYGDEFIKALAYTIIKHSLSRRQISKIVLVGEMPGWADFVLEVSNLQVPVSIQSHCPSRYEIMIYRLMYEKGNVVSNSQINPHKWEKGNLVIIFDSQYHQLSIAIPDVMLIKLTNESQGLSTELETRLQSSQIDPLLCNLAPIMETCLLQQAGFWRPGSEQDIVKGQKIMFQSLADWGHRTAIWDLFLDKVA